MEKGDAPLTSPPRALVIGNDFLVRYPNKYVHVVSGRGFGRAKRLVNALEIDPQVRNWLHDLSWRRALRLDVVMIGWDDRFCDVLHERLDRLNLSVAAVYGVSDIKELVGRLAYMPEVVYIFHGRTDWQLAFGPRARFGISGMASL